MFLSREQKKKKIEPKIINGKKLEIPENVSDTENLSFAGCDNLKCIVIAEDSDINAKDKEISLDFGRKGEFEVYLLDESHDATLLSTAEKLDFVMKKHSCILIKEI